MAPVIDRQMHLLGLKIEVASGHIHHRRIDFHDIHAHAVLGKIPWHDPHAQSNAERVTHIGHIGPRQLRQQIGKGGRALLARRVVRVLNQVVI